MNEIDKAVELSDISSESTEDVIEIELANKLTFKEVLNNYNKRAEDVFDDWMSSAAYLD